MNASESATIRIDDQQRLVTVDLEGPMTDSRLIALSRRMRAMEEQIGSHNILVDTSKTTEMNLSASVIFSLAQTSRPRSNRIAIVAPDVVAFGMARMYEMSVSRNAERVRVFTELESALLSLGCRPDWLSLQASNI